MAETPLVQCQAAQLYFPPLGSNRVVFKLGKHPSEGYHYPLQSLQHPLLGVGEFDVQGKEAEEL